MLDFAPFAALASKQHGTISRAQLSALGMKPAMIQRSLTRAQLEVIHPGVYLVAGARRTREVTFWAALHDAGDGAVLARRSAAWHWRLEGLGKAPPAVVDITVPHGRRVISSNFIDVRRSRTLVLGKDFATLYGIPCTSLARTVVDLSGVLTPSNLEHAFDSAVRRDWQNRDAIIEALFRLGFGRPDTRALTTIVERNEHGCTQSWLEDHVRQVFRANGIPTPRPQHRINDKYGRLITVSDFAWPEVKLVVMCDSWEFH